MAEKKARTNIFNFPSPKTSPIAETVGMAQAMFDVRERKVFMHI